MKQAVVEDHFDEVLTHVLGLAQSNIDAIKDKVEELLLSDDYRTISGDGIPGENQEIYVGGVYKPH